MNKVVPMGQNTACLCDMCYMLTAFIICEYLLIISSFMAFSCVNVEKTKGERVYCIA